MVYFGIDENCVIKVAFEAKDIAEAKKMYPKFRIYVFNPNRYVITSEKLLANYQWLFPQEVIVREGVVYFESIKHKYHTHAHNNKDASDINSWETMDIASLNYGNKDNSSFLYSLINDKTEYILRRDYGKMIFKKRKARPRPGVLGGSQMNSKMSWSQYWESFQTGTNDGRPVYGIKVESLI